MNVIKSPDPHSIELNNRLSFSNGEPQPSSQESIIHEIQNRMHGERDPSVRLALAIEGGGMRGVISGAMVAALEDMAIDPTVFDAIYGSSAGAVNGAYYIAGQAREGTSIYYEDITGPEFLSWQRVLKRNSPLSLEYLVQSVMRDNKPLDHSKVIDSKRLRPVATDADHGVRYVFPAAQSQEELESQLLSSARIPMMAGKPYSHEGKRYLDGSFSEGTPWKAPQDDGFNHVLVLGTRPLGMSRETNKKSTMTLAVASRFAPPGSRALIRECIATGKVMTEELHKAVLEGYYNGAKVAAITPGSEEGLPDLFEQDKDALIHAAKLGCRAVEDFFDVPHATKFRTEHFFGQDA